MTNTVKKHIQTPITKEQASNLQAGDAVLISGVIYMARDAAHKRMIEALDNGNDLPIDLMDQIVYYAGPSPAKMGEVIGSAGPTTSGRMDAYTPTLLNLGLRGMIGKGYRNKEVVESMINNGAVYFAAIGGAGALIAKTIKSYDIIAYHDLGPEALAKLVVEDFPAIVVIDSRGNNYYEEGQKPYREI